MKGLILMKRGVLISVLLALTIFSLSGCKKEEAPVESSSLAVIEPETSETIADKLPESTAEAFVIEYETVGVKEKETGAGLQADVAEESSSASTEPETVGIVETLSPEPSTEASIKDNAEESKAVENLQADVIVDENNQVGVEAAYVDVDESLTEEQMVMMDGICTAWEMDETLGEDYLDYKLENSSLNSLSAESKQKIKDHLMKYYPHSNPEPYNPEN